MVKPALPYLDIIASAAELVPDHPLACYQVSGEYAMVVAGARAGVYDLRTMAFESVESMIRAGVFFLSFWLCKCLLAYYWEQVLHLSCLTLRLISLIGWMRPEEIS